MRGSGVHLPHRRRHVLATWRSRAPSGAVWRRWLAGSGAALWYITLVMGWREVVDATFEECTISHYTEELGSW
jgi:hypothetical protein